MAAPCLPFFIEWDRGTVLPGRTRVAHRAGDVCIERLVLEGDAERLSAWLGGSILPITVSAGEPASRRSSFAATPVRSSWKRSAERREQEVEHQLWVAANA